MQIVTVYMCVYECVSLDIFWKVKKITMTVTQNVGQILNIFILMLDTDYLT